MIFNKKNKALQELGFYDDQEGILERYYNEKKGWLTHLENTKKHICKSAKKSNNKSCAILGSGWLLDVPIQELSEIFSEVHLIDILHPKEIKQKIKRYPNVQCIEQDITGGYIQAVYELFKNADYKTKTALNELKISNLNFTEKYDFVSSVNILNQLDILLIDYIKQYDLYSETELNDFRKQIQQNHLNSLPRGKTCLITDFEEIIIENEIPVEKKTLLYTELPKTSETEQWQWEFDSMGLYNKGKKTVFNVLAINL